MFGINVMMKEKLSSSRIFCSHDDDELFVMIDFLTATSMIYVNVCEIKKKEKKRKLELKFNFLVKHKKKLFLTMNIMA